MSNLVLENPVDDPLLDTIPCSQQKHATLPRQRRAVWCFRVNLHSDTVWAINAQLNKTRATHADATYVHTLEQAISAKIPHFDGSGIAKIAQSETENKF